MSTEEATATAPPKEATAPAREGPGPGAGGPRQGSKLRRMVRALFTPRVPVILQFNTTECGPACLAMILSYHGFRTSVADCRDLFDAGRDGASAKLLAQAARARGLVARAFSVTLDKFDRIELPAIVYWSFSHFVVVERWTPTYVDIIDPGIGRRRVAIEEFDECFTGIALTFAPGPGFQRRARLPRTWIPHLSSLLGLGALTGLLTQILFTSLLLQVFGLALPILTQVVVDRVLVFRSADLMTILAAGIAVLVLTQLVTAHLRSALNISLYARIDQRMMIGLFERLLALPLRFFQQRTTGDLMTRIGSNVAIREALTNRTLSALLDGTFVVLYLAILMVKAPLFGAIALGIGALQVVLLLATSGRRHTLMQQHLATQAESQSYLTEALTGIATLKASGAEDRALAHWSELFLRHLDVSIARSHQMASLDATMMTVRTLAPLILLWVGAQRVIEGSITLGSMLAFNALAAAFLMPLASLVTTTQQLQIVSANVERLMDVLEATPEQDRAQARTAPTLAGRIELCDVSFRYDKSSPYVVRDVSVTLEAGKKIALVGRTGSGKTTLGLLLLGLHEPTEGEILYDGVPLRQLDYRSLRGQFGAVLQEPFLFTGSLRDNIAFNDPELSLEGVSEAASLAAIHDEIKAMPMGYETRVAGSGGFSGGQRQRLSLARALSKRPRVLLLDEATSHLDVLTEAQVEENLNRLACTRIVIAHRLSTVHSADLILVLDQGKIVERGAHAELMALGGHYAALVGGQMNGLASEPPRQAT